MKSRYLKTIQTESELPYVARVLIATAIMALGLLTCVGCGGPEDPRGKRVGVHGEVRLDGQPLSQARIVFLPAEGDAKVEATGTIQDGGYEIAPEHGPLVGKTRVEIHPEEIEFEEVEAALAETKGKMPELSTVRIPPQYNTRSHLTADVTERGKNKFDFELKSRP